MVRFALVLLFAFSLTASAQNWEWQQYDGDYRNPTGFPQQGMWIGDFDGNGVNEMLCRLANGFDIFSLDSPIPPLHWSKYSGNQFIGSTSAQWVSIVNLDSDPADELLMFEDFGDAHGWKAISSSPWTWEQRDDLLTAFNIPESAISMAVGDFDDDDLTEAAYTLAVDCICAIVEIQEFDGSTWIPDTTIEEHTWNHPDLFSGDFDNDGDTDLGMNTNFIDTHPFVIMIENTGSGLGLPVGIPRYCGYGGGDIDQDGAWEGVRRNLTWERGTREIIEWSDLGVIADSIDVTAFAGQVLGNLNINGENVVAGFIPWTRDTPDGYSKQTFWRYYSEAGWRDLDIGIPVDDGLTLATSLIDLNGDGLKDIFRAVERFQYPATPNFYKDWEVWLNTGDETHDYFTRGTSQSFELFLEDTAFVYEQPQVGDINGDGQLEMIVKFKFRDSIEFWHLRYYTVEGDFRQENMHQTWNIALPGPSSANRLLLADLDDDNRSEAFYLDEMTSGWFVYFFRNGH